MGEFTKTDVIDVMGELVDAITAYADRIDREVELVVRTDGTAVLMGASETCRAGEPADTFEAIEEFDSIGDLWIFLRLGERPAAAEEEPEAADVEA